MGSSACYAATVFMLLEELIKEYKFVKRHISVKFELRCVINVMNISSGNDYSALNAINEIVKFNQMTQVHLF